MSTTASGGCDRGTAVSGGPSHHAAQRVRRSTAPRADASVTGPRRTGTGRESQHGRAARVHRRQHGQLTGTQTCELGKTGTDGT